MPAKAPLVTRDISISTVTVASTPKGSGLTNSELDSNFLNLRDQSMGIKGSDSTVHDVRAGDTVTFTDATVTSDSTGIFIDTGGGAETVTALTSSAAITVDCALGTVFTVTLAHNATFTLSNFGTGQTVAIKIKQDATGGRTATFTGIKFLNAFSTLSTGANKIDFVTIFNDGTDQLAVLNVNYA